MRGDEGRFVEAVLRNDVNRAVLARGHLLGVPDWWLTAGAVFQTVWNVLGGRDPHTGISDYDLFYFDAADLSWEAEDAVIRRAGELFADLDGVVEVRNEARVHLWYEQRFGVPGVRFRSTADAVDHFASTTCCYALTSDPAGAVRVYAPHGYDDLFRQRVRPNPVLAPREVYEAKTARWAQQWPALSIEPWTDGTTQAASIPPPVESMINAQWVPSAPDSSPEPPREGRPAPRSRRGWW